MSPAPGPLKVSVEPNAPEAVRDQVRRRLDAFNIAASGHAEYANVSVFLRDERGEIFGGLLGNLWGGWLHVAILWVSEAARGQGHGRALLEAAERGCVGAWLTTFSFQAPEFYPKLGYQSIGVLEDQPAGHRHHFFQKRLV